MGQKSWMTILFIVSVPVLSEHKIVIPAISSMAVRRVTMAPRSDSSPDPRDKVVVVTISMAIGIEATMSTTVKLKASCSRSPLCKRYINTIPQSNDDITVRTSTMEINTLCMLLISGSNCKYHIKYTLTSFTSLRIIKSPYLQQRCRLPKKCVSTCKFHRGLSLALHYGGAHFRGVSSEHGHWKTLPRQSSLVDIDVWSMCIRRRMRVLAIKSAICRNGGPRCQQYTITRNH